MKPFLYISIALFIFSCSSKKRATTRFGGDDYISVKSFGAKGNGKTDDVTAIQRAFDNCEKVYFPKGKYRISSAQYGEHNPQSLLITDRSSVRQIYFEEGAALYIKNDFNFDGVKNTILKVFAEKGDIKQLRIDGLSILCETMNYQRSHTGVFAIEYKGHHIRNLEIVNASFKNLSGSGILTYAKKTVLKNIYTENTIGNGIGALNAYNHGEEHFLYIDGYESINDRAYSIDFSGTEPAENRKVAVSGDTWTGIAKNIKSINSKRGIKTAGHWNLELENVEIINPEIFGFFINKDSPDRIIKIKNMRIENAGDAGMTLDGNTKLDIRNLKIINCTEGLLLQGSKVKIDSLLVDGKNKANKGIRIPNEASIKNFSVTGIKDDYPIWIMGKNISLTNGRIYNNDGPYSLLIHENSDNIQLDNIEFYDDRPMPKQIYGMLIIQKKGELKVNKLNMDRLKSTKIINKTKINIIERQ